GLKKRRYPVPIIVEPNPNRIWPTIVHKVSKLRRHSAYQRVLWQFRWWFVPHFFGLLMLFVAGIVVFAIGVTSAARLEIGYSDRVGRYCEDNSDPSFQRNVLVLAKEFRTDSICWPTGILVQRGKQYRIFLDVIEPWADADGTYANPIGVDLSKTGT